MFLAIAKSNVHFLVLFIFEFKLLKQSVSSFSLNYFLHFVPWNHSFCSFPTWMLPPIQFFFPDSSSSFLTQGLILDITSSQRLSPLVVLSGLMTVNIIHTPTTLTSVISSLDYPLELRLCVFSCPLTVYIRMFNKHFKLSIL